MEELLQECRTVLSSLSSSGEAWTFWLEEVELLPLGLLKMLQELSLFQVS